MIEDMIVNMVSNAPAVVVLFYLVVRLDQRLEQMELVLIDLLRASVPD